MPHAFFFSILPLLLALISHSANAANSKDHAKTTKTQPLQCVAFSPYVGKLSPDYGAPPSRALINQLLDTLIKETPYRCISSYGVINGLDVIFAAAKERKLKVIAILWIDKDISVNSQSIAKGIALAKEYPDTIIKLSCGNEVRTRHGYQFDGEISRCIDGLKQAGIKQPVTTIDTWWEWCNRSNPCQPNSFSQQVDWVGINVFPWWENVFSDVLPCISAEKAADFHIDRLKAVQAIHPKIPVVLTEFGWPSGPEGSYAINQHSKQKCAQASKQNQQQVIKTTFQKLAKSPWTGIAFEAFSENWKPDSEGNAGGYWGLCSGEAPFSCK